jgi:hypothetical protein
MPVTAQYNGNGNFGPIISGGPPSLQTITRHDTDFTSLNHAGGEAQLAESPENIAEGSGPVANPLFDSSGPNKMARCLALAKRMLGPLKEIRRLERNYDPARNTFDLELIANGGFSPLDRYMGLDDYLRVRQTVSLVSAQRDPESPRRVHHRHTS